MSKEVKRRQYDASNLHRQSAATRQRILEAAQLLFARNGYGATTMHAIAEQAGVAVQTVYASMKSKRNILQGILDLAVSGADERVPVVASSRWLDIEREPDPRARLTKFARLHREICDREASAYAIMADAAGSDADIRSLMSDISQRRYRDQQRLERTFRRDGYIRKDLTSRHATDIIWTLASERTYLALVVDRGWSAQGYEDWLVNQLVSAILV